MQPKERSKRGLPMRGSTGMKEMESPSARRRSRVRGGNPHYLRGKTDPTPRPSSAKSQKQKRKEESRPMWSKMKGNNWKRPRYKTTKELKKQREEQEPTQQGTMRARRKITKTNRHTNEKAPDEKQKEKTTKPKKPGLEMERAEGRMCRGHWV